MGTRSNVRVQPAKINVQNYCAVNDQVSVFGRIDNLFDVHYQDPIGIERPGFGIYGGMRFAVQ